MVATRANRRRPEKPLEDEPIRKISRIPEKQKNYETKENILEVSQIDEERYEEQTDPKEIPYAEVVPLPTVKRIWNDRKSKQQTNTQPGGFRNQSPLQSDEKAKELVKEVLKNTIGITIEDLLNVSESARQEMKELLTKKRVEKKSVTFVEEREDTRDAHEEEEEVLISVDKLPDVSYAILEEEIKGVPKGAVIIGDPVLQYLSTLQPGETPKKVVAAKESYGLRVVYPLINGVGEVEALLDSGSQIISMSKEVAEDLEIAWDPDIIVHMQSANRALEQTLGLAKNVPFVFGNITVYLQIHVMEAPAYKVLLGRPFDTVTESLVKNERDGSQSLTLTDPNSGERYVMRTYERGKPPSVLKKTSEGGFWASFDDLIREQGEAALVIEGDEGSWKITGYTLPRRNTSFEQEEMRNAFLAQSMTNKKFEDKDRAVLTEYLENGTRKKQEEGVRLIRSTNMVEINERSVYKYKPVDKKVKPVVQELPAEFRIRREIKGDPLAEMPTLSPKPPNFEPTGRYTQERKDQFDKVHKGNFLLPEERKLMHHFMMLQNQGFAWDDSERGRFREDFFPPVDIPVIPHKPWVLKNIPIPPGLYQEVCRIIKTKLEAGVYEPSNSSYRSRWFCVIKKDGKSLRLVHSLEPLNEVTIAHSGVPPATETLVAQFAGRACRGMFDLYVGYDERTLAEKSRDLTTFQTPFGALRLVTLPMGWTNSVPIFHDDVTFILQPEIPEFTVPFIDDVPVKGPKSRYELRDGIYEKIKENEGIRRFVWEHFQNVNWIVQRMKYCGGTFLGYKSTLCAEEITVVGHRCTREGRLPEVDRVGVINRWSACKNVSEVRMFLGTIGVCRVFIRDFAKLAGPLNNLLRLNTPFVWGPEHDQSMSDLKEALGNAVPLGNIDYEQGGTVVLAVDTSWKAVGFYIYQESADEKKKRIFIKFGSITLNEREAKFSQPKRELFRLKRALEASEYLLIGC